MAASKTLTPEQRRERARKAGQTAHSVDRAIQRIVESATPEQLQKLADLLRRR